ncbi:MAG: CDP-alcohol phosphatidyltransferase family protein [Candidatus Nanopelagicaceae bacterium]|jgi:cardiolipin synthase
MTNVRGDGDRSPSNLTIPNALTLLRALGIPVFLWALFAGNQDFLAIVILVLAGATDYLDGKLARALNQYSRLGELLDPLVDRLYIAAVLIGLTIRGVIPLWLLTLLILRDLILATTLPGLYRIGKGPLPVTFLGKAATLNLLYAFPLLLLAEQNGAWASAAGLFATAFAGWGVLLYLLTGVQYFFEARSQIRGASDTVTP